MKPKKTEAELGVNPSSFPTMDELLGTDYWGIDTMASINVCGNRLSFGALRGTAEVAVKVANGQMVSVKQCGTIVLKLVSEENKKVRAVVDKVYYSPIFKTNLLSWCLLKRKGWQLHSSNKGDFITTPMGTKIPVQTRGNVMTLSTNNVERVSSSVKEVNATIGTGLNPFTQLHAKLGHISPVSLLKLINNKKLMDMPKMTEDQIKAGTVEIKECDVCVQAKFRRTNFGHNGLYNGNAPGEALHMDTFFVPMEDIGQKLKWMEYGVSIVDPFSKGRWFHWCNNKGDIPSKVIETINYVEKQFGCKVKHLFVDGGG